MAGQSTRKGFIAALIVGTLVVPGVAIALTNGLSDANRASNESAAPLAITETTTTTTGAPATTTTVADDGLADQDLALACGEEGLALVAGEAADEISDIEVAALTALREICEEEGSPLPAAPAPEITEIVVVQAAPSPITTAAPDTDDASGDHDDDRDEEDEEADETDETDEDEDEDHVDDEDDDHREDD